MTRYEDKSIAQLAAEAYEGGGVDYSDIWKDADIEWKRRWHAAAAAVANRMCQSPPIKLSTTLSE